MQILLIGPKRNRTPGEGNEKLIRMIFFQMIIYREKINYETSTICSKHSIIET